MGVWESLTGRPSAKEVAPAVDTEAVAAVKKINQLRPQELETFASASLRDNLAATFGSTARLALTELVILAFPNSDQPISYRDSVTGTYDMYTLGQDQDQVNRKTGIDAVCTQDTLNVDRFILYQGFLRTELPHYVTSAAGFTRQRVFAAIMETTAKDLEEARSNWAASLQDNRSQFMDQVEQISPYTRSKVDELRTALATITTNKTPDYKGYTLVGTMDETPKRSAKKITLYTTGRLDMEVYDILRRTYGPQIQPDSVNDESLIEFNRIGSDSNIKFTFRKTDQHKPFVIEIRSAFRHVDDSTRLRVSLPEWDFADYLAGRRTAHRFAVDWKDSFPASSGLLDASRSSFAGKALAPSSTSVS